LPFANLSSEADQEYFADGIAGEIRNILTRVAGLKVAGSTSSEAVREDDAQTAAKKLGVINILTGTVRQTPSTIRVTAELIDGDTGLSGFGPSSAGGSNGRPPAAHPATSSTPRTSFMARIKTRAGSKINHDLRTRP
jgi:hypothetical protein